MPSFAVIPAGKSAVLSQTNPIFSDITFVPCGPYCFRWNHIMNTSRNLRCVLNCIHVININKVYQLVINPRGLIDEAGRDVKKLNVDVMVCSICGCPSLTAASGYVTFGEFEVPSPQDSCKRCKS